MITVKRPPLPDTPAMHIWRVRAKRALDELLARWTHDPGWRRPDFKRPLWTELRPLLSEVFSGKCAYCESRLVGSLLTIDQFRPKVRVIEDPEFGGYWWLAYDWNNLYAACQVCNSMKASRFPIEGPRASFDRLGSLGQERPLLLDPCDESDSPEDQLAFGEDGIVAPKSKRGEVTIQVLGLNRGDLILARREAIANVRDRVNLAILQNRLAEEFKEMESGSEPYSAARRAALHRLVLNFRHQIDGSAEGRKLVRVAKRTNPLSSSDVQELAKRAEQSLEAQAQIFGRSSRSGRG